MTRALRFHVQTRLLEWDSLHGLFLHGPFFRYPHDLPQNGCVVAACTPHPELNPYSNLAFSAMDLPVRYGKHVPFERLFRVRFLIFFWAGRASGWCVGIQLGA